MAFFVIKILTLYVIDAIMRLIALWHLLFSEKRYTALSLQIKTLWRYERFPTAPPSPLGVLGGVCGVCIWTSELRM